MLIILCFSSRSCTICSNWTISQCAVESGRFFVYRLCYNILTVMGIRSFSIYPLKYINILLLKTKLCWDFHKQKTKKSLHQKLYKQLETALPPILSKKSERSLIQSNYHNCALSRILPVLSFSQSIVVLVVVVVVSFVFFRNKGLATLRVTLHYSHFYFQIGHL